MGESTDGRPDNDFSTIGRFKPFSTKFKIRGTPKFTDLSAAFVVYIGFIILNRIFLDTYKLFANMLFESVVSSNSPGVSFPLFLLLSA